MFPDEFRISLHLIGAARVTPSCRMVDKAGPKFGSMPQLWCSKVLSSMPQNVSHLRVVLASPGDVSVERKAFSGLVEQINRDTGRAAGIELELWMWETDSKPGFHIKGPQGLIDEVLRIEDCDLFVGIFWNRIGTPTPDGMTGTEHEFSAAYKSWQRNRRPEIMFYFNEKASTLTSKEALDQRGKVLDFRNSFPEEGLYWPYNGKAEFLKHANDHLRKFIQQQISMQATAKSGTTHGDGENDNAHKEQKFFSFIVGKDGAVQLPIDMLSQLGLAEGGRLEFTVANHRVINVLPVAAPFNPSAIELLSKRQNAIAENLEDSEFGRTLRKRGRHD